MAAGYSSTPLCKKLGIKPGYAILAVNAPENYLQLLEDLPENVALKSPDAADLNMIHYFTTDAETYYKNLPLLMKQIVQNGMIWISWPKKASKIQTNITEDIIRDYALEIGLVDIKVCAVDEIWSGLKLVIPVKKRLI